MATVEEQRAALQNWTNAAEPSAHGALYNGALDPNDPYVATQRAQLEKARSNIENQGYTTGSFWRNEPAFDQSQANPLQSAAERDITSQRNYSYGGTPQGADEAVAAARAAAAQGASPLAAQALTTQRRGEWLGTQYANQGNQILSRATPQTAYQYNPEDRARQEAAYNTLMGGVKPVNVVEGPSAAQAQLQMGTNQALNSQLALARSGRGAGESASAMRSAAFNSAGLQQNAANQAAMLRAQEAQNYQGRVLQSQLAAQGLTQQGQQAAGGLAQGIRAQDIGQAQFGTQAELQAQQQNAQAALGYAALGANAELGYRGAAQKGYAGAAETTLQGEQLANTIRGQELQGHMGYETNLSNLALGKQAAAGDQGPNWGDYAQTAAEVAGAVALASSDIGAKTNIAATPQGGGYQYGGMAQAAQQQYQNRQVAPPGQSQQQYGGMAQAQPQAGGPVNSYEQAQGMVNAVGQGQGAGGPVNMNNYTFDRSTNAWRTAQPQGQQPQQRPPPGGYGQYIGAQLAGAPQGQGMAQQQQQNYGQFTNDVRRYAAPSPGAVSQQPPPTRWAGQASAAMLSDKRAKDLSRELDAIKAENEQLRTSAPAVMPRTADMRGSPGYYYDYKDPAMGAGRQYGPMAQDLAQQPATAHTVVPRSDGYLGVDTGKLALANTGAISEMQKQLDALQAKKAAEASRAASASPAEYPTVVSDKAAKELRDENAALKSQIGQVKVQAYADASDYWNTKHDITDQQRAAAARLQDEKRLAAEHGMTVPAMAQMGTDAKMRALALQQHELNTSYGRPPPVAASPVTVPYRPGEAPEDWHKQVPAYAYQQPATSPIVASDEQSKSNISQIHKAVSGLHNLTSQVKAASDAKAQGSTETTDYANRSAALNSYSPPVAVGQSALPGYSGQYAGYNYSSPAEAGMVWGSGLNPEDYDSGSVPPATQYGGYGSGF